MPEAESAPTEAPEAEEQTTGAAPETGASKADIERAVKLATRMANKEAETLRLKLKEFQERDLTAAQKLESRAVAAEARAQDLEMRAIRAEVAAEKGLPKDLAARLIGTTADELAEDADRLKALLAPPADDPATAPVFDLGQRGLAATRTVSMSDLIRDQAGVRRR